MSKILVLQGPPASGKSTDARNVIKENEHGVIVKKGHRQGVFLPQVATETGWSRDTFMNRLCIDKAGIAKDSWKDGSAEIFIFSVQLFSEK